ncbi:thiamine pyrophosphate-dependent dehydrogenase E1 component subunit alpha [Williamsoniiplasma luminosum]|uniref:2-oxoisovalerate dehydrogenase subunit alpha n=1 Tax=Williamsoniiplasma luminosum TaxID=214888 RepID=A0A2S0NK69_9MOLU|nr:thiamine pyrophosphate-dependent dehydrogenase E1 component subunit alpha [Williamsoniiplasma luminosum]AVP49416.1 MAG: pyruvate dehydrogenase (acetyl-transferring) E1 component subunit alpha [Williamsoniiplasma luminosum]
MAYKYIGKFDPVKNESVNIMDENGKIINKALMPNIKNETLIEAYKLMCLSRSQDNYQNKQQRLGKILSFLSSTGQEAGEIAYSMHVQKGKDWFLPAYRNNAAWLATGMPMKNIMMYWMGNEYGCVSPEGINNLPINIVIGSQYSHAAGIAFAEKFNKKSDSVVLTTTGDGGTSQGEVYEALNFAQLRKLPVIFVVEDNKWAISHPSSGATAAINFAVKGMATGTPGIKVDGNDFLASYGVFEEAFDYVRKGNGPILIELNTYRLGAHSSSDNPDVYRPKGEYEEAVKFDPLIRMKNYLVAQKLWDDKKQADLDQENEVFIDKSFNEAMASKDYPLNEVFDYMYAEKTDLLKEQYAEAKAFFDQYPESKDGGHH